MHPNFMHIRQKINFKKALEFFTPVNGHLRTALRVILEKVRRKKNCIAVL